MIDLELVAQLCREAEDEHDAISECRTPSEKQQMISYFQTKKFEVRDQFKDERAELYQLWMRICEPEKIYMSHIEELRIGLPDKYRGFEFYNGIEIPNTSENDHLRAEVKRLTSELETLKSK